MAKILIGKYEGTIYPEGNGYTGAISLGFHPNGKRNRLKRKARTKEAVKQKLIDAVEELEKGIKTDATYTVKDCVEDFLTTLAKTDLAPGSLKTYRSLATENIISEIGAIKLKELRADHVERWLHGRSERLATQSLKIVHSLLTRSIRRAQRHDLVGRNVSALVDTPRGLKGRPSKSLTLAQAATLLTEAAKPEHRIGAYVILAIQSGLRTEELRKLTWADVDLEEGAVYVLRSDRHGDDTKTPASRRGLSIPAAAIEALSALRKRQAAERLAAGQVYRDHDLVFCHEDGTPYTNKDVHGRFKKLTKAAGIGTDWVPRELRHTFVSLLSDHGVPIEKISDLVGHADTATTRLVYRHQLKPVIKDGAEAMSDIFGGKADKSA